MSVDAERPPARGLGDRLARLADLTLAGQEDATVLGLWRVLFVALVTVVYTAHGASLTEHFTAASMLNGAWAREAFPSRWSLFFLVDDPVAVRAVFVAGLLAHLAWCAGAGTRVTGPLAMLVWVSLMGRQPLLYAYPDRLALILGLLLALMPAGRGFSVDAWLRARRGLPPRTVPVWCRRIVQLQLAVVYTATGLEKTGVTWTKEGTALYYTLVNPHNRHFDLAAPLARVQPWLLRPATYLTLAWEVGFAPFVALHWLREVLVEALRGGRREPLARKIPDLRPLFLGFGVLMHVTVQLALYVVHFSWLMLFTYLVFLTPAELAALRSRWRAAPRAGSAAR